jgi:hypothetical protein
MTEPNADHLKCINTNEKGVQLHPFLVGESQLDGPPGWLQANQIYAFTGLACRMWMDMPSAAMWLLLRLRMVSDRGRNSASS